MAVSNRNVRHENVHAIDYLFARFSIMRVTDAADFQIGKISSCVRLQRDQGQLLILGRKERGSQRISKEFWLEANYMASRCYTTFSNVHKPGID